MISEGLNSDGTVGLPSVMECQAFADKATKSPIDTGPQDTTPVFILLTRSLTHIRTHANTHKHTHTHTHTEEGTVHLPFMVAGGVTDGVAGVGVGGVPQPSWLANSHLQQSQRERKRTLLIQQQ